MPQYRGESPLLLELVLRETGLAVREVLNAHKADREAEVSHVYDLLTVVKIVPLLIRGILNPVSSKPVRQMEMFLGFRLKLQFPITLRET